MHNLNALIFDLDGTLTLTQRFHYLAFSEVFKKHGVDYTEADDMRFAGKGSHCIFPEFFGEHGVKLDTEQIATYSDEKKNIYDAILIQSEIREVPGATAFLERMKKRGLKIAVASGNKPEAIDFILQRAGLDPYVDVVMANKYVKHSKPDPDVFLAAARRLGVVPEESIVFEDAVNGIEAARAAHMKCIALSTGFSRKVLSEAGADAVFENFTHIGDAILIKLFE